MLIWKTYRWHNHKWRVYIFFRKWKRLPASASPHTMFTLLHSVSDIAEDKSGKREMQKKYARQSLLLNFHPWEANNSNVVVSSFLLADRTYSFVSSSRCSSAQTCNQYVPLKVACIKDVYLQFPKIRSLRRLQIAQRKAATPTRIYFFSFKSKFDSQLPNIWHIESRGVNPVTI